VGIFNEESEASSTCLIDHISSKGSDYILL